MPFFFQGIAASILQRRVAVLAKRRRFPQTFVAERRRQWNIEKQLNELENRISLRMSDNLAAIGSILSKNDRVLKQSDDYDYQKPERHYIDKS